MKKIMFAFAILATTAAAIPAAAQSVDQREHRQEQRIRQGERSGQLTPGESRRLQHRERRLHRTEARMRWHNGGALRPQQRQHLRRMEGRDSAAMYRLKHNRRSY